jgi:hypothetical protein
MVHLASDFLASESCIVHSNIMSEQIDALTLEEHAARVVVFIQECVQVLRSPEEFAPSACNPLDTVDLFARFEHDVVPRIHRLVESITSVQVDDTIYISDGLAGKRYDTVRCVLWPLAACLGHCYAALDELSPEPEILPARGKPRPPPGLLSIQNYTDIAALMEFLVCTSILPLLQRGILSSAEERARYFLPKSLAGRIPRRSLLWGCAVQNATSSSDMSVSGAIVELRTTVATMGRVLLLDRFRPMLLPRHMADLYAAIFQADALEKRWNQPLDEIHQVPSHYPEVLQMLLSVQSSSTAASILVDPHTQARAYQTLLLRGTKAPLWLRQRVSVLLSDLATRDLATIVHVFVSSVSSGDMSGASLRLARALISVPVDSRDGYFAALAQQLLILLDVPGGQPIDAPLDQSHRARVLTVWAVLDQLPLELSMKHIFPLVSRDLLSSMSHDRSNEAAGRYSVHKAVRRIGALLTTLPPSYNAWKLSRMLLSPAYDSPSRDHHDGSKAMILSQLLRIASIESAAGLSVKYDAVFALRCAVQTLEQSSFPIEKQESLGGDEIAALALVYCLAPTVLDLEGYRYIIPVGGGSESDAFQAVTLQQLPYGASRDVQSFVNDMERMAKIIVEDVFVSMTMRANREEVGETKSVPVNDEPFRLPSTIFHLLLVCYFSTVAPVPRATTSSGPNAQVGMPNVYQRIRVHIQLAVMILLPLVCEQCSPESLLLPDGSGSGILTMIKLILDCNSSIFGDNSDIDEGAEHNAKMSVPDEGHGPFHSCSGLFTEFLKLEDGDGEATEQNVDLPLEEVLISTSSVVLTLMVTMLELGSQKRPDVEEKILGSMLPSLAVLARVNKSARSRLDKEAFSIQPELAEMASHAMALIAARSQIPSRSANRDAKGRSKRQVLMDTINEAEDDLRSEQPPIRARGVLLLGRMAQTYLREADDHLRERPLVEVMDRSDKNDDDDTLRLAVSEIVRLSVVALADLESYVYLAAVQSIVAAADVSPREVIPVIGSGICSGSMSFSSVGTENAPQMTEIRLTADQRIKLTEALLFAIRRRGRAVYEFVPLLMSLMLYGRPPQDDVDGPLGWEAQIQDKTHRYFIAGNGISQDDRESVDLSRAELDLRVRTGGPIFQLEENDVLRAGCVSVLSELVSSTLPAVVARYCRVLMLFATNALNLEVSRPVTRVTAMLCNELYCAVLLEHDEAVTPTADRSFDYNVNSLAVEMVSSDEEALHSALRRCVDIKDDVVVGKQRLFDPATTERCKKALETREEVDRLGVFAAANLYVASTKQEKLNPVVDIIRNRLHEK